MTQQSQIEFGSESSQLFTMVTNLIDEIDRTVALIEDPEIKNRLFEVVDSLEKLDQNLTADVMTIESLSVESLDDKETVKNMFDEFRNALVINELGRCKDKVDSLRNKITSLTTEDDMETISVTYSEKDPISKALIKDPVKNSVCGHVYDHNSVSAFIEQCAKNRQLCQCPVRSCPNKQPLKMDRMINFPDFFNHVHKE